MGKHLQTLSLQFSKVLATFNLKVSDSHKQKRIYKFNVGKINMEIEEFNEINKHSNLFVIKSESNLIKINFFKNSTQSFDKIKFKGLREFGYYLQYSNESLLKSISAFENNQSSIELIKINYDLKINNFNSLVLLNNQNVKLLSKFDTKSNHLIFKIKEDRLN